MTRLTSSRNASIPATASPRTGSRDRRAPRRPPTTERWCVPTTSAAAATRSANAPFAARAVVSRAALGRLLLLENGATIAASAGLPQTDKSSRTDAVRTDGAAGLIASRVGCPAFANRGRIRSCPAEPAKQGTVSAAAAAPGGHGAASEGASGPSRSRSPRTSSHCAQTTTLTVRAPPWPSRFASACECVDGRHHR